MEIPYVEFVYVGPPDPIEWRQPELGMRTDGLRCAINVPEGHVYDRRIVGDPFLTGSREVWVTIAMEHVWYDMRSRGVDPRVWTTFAPGEVVWIEWRTIRDD